MNKLKKRWFLAVTLSLVALLPTVAVAEAPQVDAWRLRVAELFFSVVDRIELTRERLDVVENRFSASVIALEQAQARFNEQLAQRPAFHIVTPDTELSAKIDSSLTVIRDRSPQTIWLKHNQPIDIEFPAEVIGGFKPKDIPLNFERIGRHVILVLNGSLAEEGIIFLCGLKDGTIIAIQVKEAKGDQAADILVKIDKKQ